MRPVALAIATVGGAGYIPLAPGTAGSAVGIAIYLLTRPLEPAIHLGLFVMVCAVGIWASGIAAAHFGRDDPGHVVVDEVAGQLATLLLLDVGVIGAAAGFVIFRVFDIIKPWPANRLEALHGGFGIMADDIMAGAYGWMLLAALVYLFPWLQ